MNWKPASHKTVFVLVLLVAIVTGCSPATPTTERTPATATTAPTTAASEATAAPTATTAAVTTVGPTATAPATSTVTPAATERPQGAPTTGSGDQPPTGQAAFDFLVEVSKAQLQEDAWRATITSDDGGAETVTVIEFVKPGSFHLVAGDETEIIIIPGEGTFLREGDTWQNSPIDMSGMMGEFLTQQNIEEALKQANVNELEYEGTETLEGRRMWVYSYSATIDSGGVSVETDTKLWLGVEDKLPYRYETVSKADDTIATNVIVYEYDPGITIEKPDIAS